MLNAMFASPYYIDPTLDPSADPVEAASRVQDALKYTRRRSSSGGGAATTMHQHNAYQAIDTEVPTGPPSMLQRRASLEAVVDGGSGSVGAGPLGQPKRSSGKLHEILGKVDMPYEIKENKRSQEEERNSKSGMVRWADTCAFHARLPMTSASRGSLYACLCPQALTENHPPFETNDVIPQEASNSNGLPLIEMSTLSQPKGLINLCRGGFASSQRKDVWPRLLVLPSTGVHVDITAYYQTVERVWHLSSGRLTSLVSSDADLFGMSDVHQIELNRAMPTVFPDPPTLGRNEPFEWNNMALDKDEKDITAQKRILCAICATHELKYAPQLPSLVCVVYHTLLRDEPRTFSFVSAMVERSKRDEHFLLLSPVSLELLVQGFGRSCARHLAELDRHLAATGFSVTDWFRRQVSDGFLASTLPIEVILRVWDVALVSGTHAAYLKLGMTLLARFEPYLLSGVEPTKEDILTKLTKLMSMINLTSFFGSTLKDGLGWRGKECWLDKSDLSKLTAPTRESSLYVPNDLQELNAITYHVPWFVPASKKENGIMTRDLVHRLYSGILPSNATNKDPVCLYSTNTDGHSLGRLLRAIWTDASDHSSSSSVDVGGGSLLLARTIQKKTFGIYFHSFPRPAKWNDQTLRLGKTPRTIPWPHAGLVVNIEKGSAAASSSASSSSVSIVKRFMGEPLSLTEETSDSPPPDVNSSVGTSLPVLPIEGGPPSSRRSSGGSDTPGRRSSLAILLGALHLKKIDDEAAITASNTEKANRMLTEVAPLSPFKHGVMRIVDSPIVASPIGDMDDLARPTFERATSSPTTPSLFRGRRISTPSSAPASPREAASPSSAKQTILAGLEKFVNFIDSVPVSRSSAASTAPASSNTSPALSRRSSMTALGSPSGPLSGGLTPTRSSRTMPSALSPNITGVAGSKLRQPGLLTLPPRIGNSPGNDSTIKRTNNGSPAMPSPGVMTMRARAQSNADKSPHNMGSGVRPAIDRRLSMPVQRSREPLNWESVISPGESKKDMMSPSGGGPVVTPGSASHHYRLSLSSPADAISLDQVIQQEKDASRRSSPSLVPRGSQSGSAVEAIPSLEPTSFLTGTPSPEVPRPMIQRSLSLGDRSASPRPTPLPPTNAIHDFLSTTAAFRAQHDFHLTIEDADANDATSHAETVHTALASGRKQTIDSIDPPTINNNNGGSSDSASVRESMPPIGMTTVLMSESTFILNDADPKHTLLFTLNDTLDEGLFECDGISIEGENGKIEYDTIEAWAFK